MEVKNRRTLQFLFTPEGTLTGKKGCGTQSSFAEDLVKLQDLRHLGPAGRDCVVFTGDRLMSVRKARVERPAFTAGRHPRGRLSVQLCSEEGRQLTSHKNQLRH